MQVQILADIEPNPSYHSPMRSTPPAPYLIALVLAVLLLWPGTGRTDEFEVTVSGVREPLLGNVRSRVQGLGISGLHLSQRHLQRLAARAERDAAAALRPYGYYHARVSSRLTRTGERSWRLELDVEPGPPLQVGDVRIELSGPGADLPELRRWKRDWPLQPGKRLDQTVWEAAKRDALDRAAQQGYLSATFVEHSIKADLEHNTANLVLQLDTGPRAVMGEIRFEQDSVRDSILALLPRFEPGQPYDAWLLDEFRLDLWQTGYFDNVEIIEERRLEADPPVVNLVVRARARKPNTYQGTVGYGTDTGIRAQFNWSRHRVSERGDQFDLGLGWQQKFNQYSVRGNYRLPRVAKAREFWVANGLFNRENQDVRVKASDTAQDYFLLSSGRVDDYSLRLGRLRVRGFERGYQQLYETWYGQYLYETVSLDPPTAQAGAVPGPDPLEGVIRRNTSALAFGVNWDWPNIRGEGFQTVGHHHRAWAVVANGAWGSRAEFNQAYLSTRWHRLLGERWKLLLRGELGYTDAEVNQVEVDTGDQTLLVSVTELPNLWRFKAGGSRSVRGYSFESLSDNGIGSNNIVTASAELEYRVLPKWSLAAFADIGNAFNHWSDYDLRKGVGVGLRWYTIAGAVRLDLAQALDLDGDPWRLHFTIGTPLL